MNRNSMLFLTPLVILHFSFCEASIIERRLAKVDSMKLHIQVKAHLDPPVSVDLDAFNMRVHEICDSTIRNNGLSPRDSSIYNLHIIINTDKGMGEFNNDSIAVNVQLYLYEKIKIGNIDLDAASTIIWKIDDLFLIREDEFEYRALESVAFLVETLCTEVSQAKYYYNESISSPRRSIASDVGCNDFSNISDLEFKIEPASAAARTGDTIQVIHRITNRGTHNITLCRGSYLVAYMDGHAITTHVASSMACNNIVTIIPESTIEWIEDIKLRFACNPGTDHPALDALPLCEGISQLSVKIKICSIQDYCINQCNQWYPLLSNEQAIKLVKSN